MAPFERFTLACMRPSLIHQVGTSEIPHPLVILRNCYPQKDTGCCARIFPSCLLHDDLDLAINTMPSKHSKTLKISCRHENCHGHLHLVTEIPMGISGQWLKFKWILTLEERQLHITHARMILALIQPWGFESQFQDPPVRFLSSLGVSRRTLDVVS